MQTRPLRLMRLLLLWLKLSRKQSNLDCSMVRITRDSIVLEVHGWKYVYEYCIQHILLSLISSI